MTSTVIKIESILKDAYSTKNFVDLVNELFPGVHLVAPDKLRKEFSNYNSYIDGSIHVGNYRTPDNKNIIIMAVQQNKARYVENARSSQRSYAKKLIEAANADAAFIAFYTEGDQKWRLSFVRLDYEMKIENGKLKTAENMTPAKRYSYLVGADEPCHTAISRFERFITDIQANPEHPTLDDLEEAFSVEKVTNEFFELYCEKFQQLREQLEANEDFCIEAQQHNFTSAQFAKKLMGQIVFLYFLQKKGWLGVGAWPDTLTEKEYKNAYYARGAKSRELIPLVYKKIAEDTYKVSGAGLNKISDDDEAVLAQCVKGKAWGTGPHNFMRRLYELAEKRNVNFYDEILEPLFYNALNVNRGEQGYCAALHCRIPFLSGGLFEPIDGYDWEHNDFNLPNSIFSNIAEKGSREADGILDIFDRYNFTICEDEPMEREVAIDPEMLGKVFENLLEVKDRKSKGAFYTPREIVHYMCQESLINYLTETLNVSEEAIRDFILYGDFMKDEDTVKEKREGSTEMYISEELYKIDSEGKVIADRLKDMDKALQDVRIADPAVGSGAFPLGMLNEIVRARQNISAYMGITMNAYDKRMMYQLERSPHALKYETIRNCIFAADIEPSAVDIAQLRLWLSLVIDDEINPDAQSALEGHRNPLPLPNLECNILCGNSLIDEFEGTRLINESDILGSGEYQISLNQERFENIIKNLIETQDELYRCDNTDKKKELLERIKDLKDAVILVQLEGCDREKINRYIETKNMASKPYVLWQLDFARVFREKGGFDIVIGNPPYVSTKGQTTNDKEVLMKKYGYADDLYYHFVDLSFLIANQLGVTSYITPDTYFTTLTKSNLREKIISRHLIKLIQLGHDVFESAMVSTSILIVNNYSSKDDDTFECIDVKNLKSIQNAPHYIVTIRDFKNSINGAFYMPTEFNQVLTRNISKVHADLVKRYFSLISTSRDIEKNSVTLNSYRKTLKPGDWTLIGLVTEGGQGLATANNGKFVGVHEGTKEATRVRETRNSKLIEVNEKYKTNYDLPVEESDIWRLFEKLKDEYGRDIFGQGYLYKIVPDSLIRDANTLTKEEKDNGIVSGPTFVTYDKGDKDGNRWYNQTPYLINWSRDNVTFLKQNSGKKGIGMPVVRNPQFYFREGFSYSDIKTFFLKCRLKGVSVHDVKSMSLFPICDVIPYYYIITLLNTEVIATFVYNFLNNTPSFQINDCRMVPIPVPNETMLIKCKELFDRAVNIQREFFDGKISAFERDGKLFKIQTEIEIWACDLYNVPVTLLKGQENYVR